MRDPIFPSDWIAPGEFHFCNRCGLKLLPPGDNVCAYCKYRIDLDDLLCGVCNVKASMFFVHGARCEKHAFQIEAIFMQRIADSDNIQASFAIVRQDFNPHDAEKVSCELMHERLFGERRKLAQQRVDDGIEPLFWLLKDTEACNEN